MKLHRTHTCEAILHILLSLSRKKSRFWCFPSQKRLCELLYEFHGVSVSRRSLNRYLDVLESEGFFRRIRRLRKGDDGRLVFGSTVYVISRKLVQYAGRWLRAIGALFERPVRRAPRAAGGGGGEILSREKALELIREAKLKLLQRGCPA